jgi:ParB-like chromosome segregation protein Spo0J
VRIERKRIADMNRARYNPRAELRKGDEEYEKLKYSLDTYGLVVPVIWNERTNNIVGGHQRLTVLANGGAEEVDVSVVDLDETREKELNITLNKVGGSWDETKLKLLLDELGDDATLTGFRQAEIDALQNDIDGLVDDGFLNDELAQLENLFNLSLTFDKQDRADINAYIKDCGKEELVKVILRKVKGAI